MNNRRAHSSAKTGFAAAKWSIELSSQRRSVPDDIVKLHFNLVMLDFPKADIAVMVDAVQEDAEAWEAAGRPPYSSPWQVESFFSSRCIHDADLRQISVSPLAKRRHVLRRTARGFLGRLASQISSDWPFMQALRAYSPELARHWPEVGEQGYLACLEQSASFNSRFAEGQPWVGHRVRASLADRTSEISYQEGHTAMKLLRTKLAVVSQAEADLLDVPPEVMLHCAIVDDYDSHVYDALCSLYQTWLEFSAPELCSYYQVASFVAYWLKRRWAIRGHLAGIPRELIQDIVAVRNYCGWANMPRLTSFARLLQVCNANVLPEGIEDDAEQLEAYLDDAEIWFRFNILGDGDPVEIDF